MYVLLQQRLVKSESEKALLELELSALKKRADELQNELELSKSGTDPPTLKKALLQWRKGFVTAYSTRAGIGLVTRVLTIRRFPRSLSDILSEKNLVFREDAVRWGLFFGTYSGGYILAQATLKYLREKQNRAKLLTKPEISSAKAGAHASQRGIGPHVVDSVLAGSISGLAVFFLGRYRVYFAMDMPSKVSSGITVVIVVL